MRRTVRLSTAVALVVAGAACGSAPPRAAEPSAAKATAVDDREYDRLCAGIPAEKQAKCPMGAWVQSAEDVEGGVLLHLDASAPPPEEAQNLMRCHRAWMAHDASNAMPRCPIGSPGIVITSRAGAAGTDLSLVASKPEDVTEIRKRTHAALSK